VDADRVEAKMCEYEGKHLWDVEGGWVLWDHLGICSGNRAACELVVEEEDEDGVNERKKEHGNRRRFFVAVPRSHPIANKPKL
jgi:hypothetical protein